MLNDTAGSLLTNGQRKFLNGDEEFSAKDSRGRTLRSRLRDRIERGIRDFSLLADPNRFVQEDVTQLFEDEPMDEGLIEMVAFLYRVQPEQIESIVENGVSRGVARCNPGYEVGEVKIPIHHWKTAIREAIDKMDDGVLLTDEEVRLLLESGEVPPEKLREYIRDHPATTSDAYRRRFR